MEKDFVQCRDGVCWTAKKQIVAALSFFGGKGRISLASGAADNSNTVFAYKCG